jgi:hypothetical protein
MTYQGARARPAASEASRVFAVSRVRLDAAGRVSDVLWSEVNPKSNLNVSAEVVVPVADVVDAVHDGARVIAVFPAQVSHVPERAFEVIEHADGVETIVLAAPSGTASSSQPTLRDIASLDRSGAALPAGSHIEAGRRVRRSVTFAVSKVELDQDGRVVNVLWGKVNTRTNAWATPEVLAPVADAVKALHAGNRVFALFPSVHGHLPDRQFVAVDYDDGRETIVLDGPTAYEREIHDMDRIDRQLR